MRDRDAMPLAYQSSREERPVYHNRQHNVRHDDRRRMPFSSGRGRGALVPAKAVGCRSERQHRRRAPTAGCDRWRRSGRVVKVTRAYHLGKPGGEAQLPGLNEIGSTQRRGARTQIQPAGRSAAIRPIRAALSCLPLHRVVSTMRISP
jgi:hypothetical protein